MWPKTVGYKLPLHWWDNLTLHEYHSAASAKVWNLLDCGCKCYTFYDFQRFDITSSVFHDCWLDQGVTL